MTDYIKKEDAIRSIADHDEFKGERWMKEAWADYLIEDAKPADVVPVRHGRWIVEAPKYYKMLNVKGIEVNEGTPYFTEDIACSECLAKFSLIENETDEWVYCPNCGAKMDEEKDDEL